jgi:1-acyl-sn-glycerol-3-phosphate acyltransferase
MLRFYYVIITAVIFNFYFIPQMWYYARHSEKYSETDRYKVGINLIKMIKSRGHIKTTTTGEENLPKQGGYIMYANHQGKYDALGIMASHMAPCTLVMDKKTSESLIINLFINLINGKRLDKKDPRQQVEIIREISAEIQNGRRYLLFPEGGYTDNQNHLQSFHSGSFKIPLMTKCPVVPVVIYDSYRAFTENSLRCVQTQVHYLEPIFYDEYAEMKSKELCELMKDLNMILVYSNKITGIYEKAEPNKDMPASVYISGTSYKIESVAAFNKLSSNGSFHYGDKKINCKNIYKKRIVP